MRNMQKKPLYNSTSGIRAFMKGSRIAKSISRTRNEAAHKRAASHRKNHSFITPSTRTSSSSVIT